ncbi:Nucleoside diphosphate kinase [Macleaya cordata]|uniref:Nucleoside diphosphate kinase n=1 Tax=Macleaya cordata TaxID=56857 RepID=A0A200R4G3_MACCD|nr:Nucleoside diphosphate kinase [Macleaya cordata]
MEAMAVLGGSSCVVSSLHSPATERNGSLSYSRKLILRTNHLAAFHPSSLFSSSSPLCHAKIRSKKNKSLIFLPHLETYIMIKPDGVQRGLVGEIISRFEKKGFKLTGLKLFQCPKELAEEHYKDLSAKPFFPNLIEYITSGPVVCMAWEGVGVVASARKLIGATNPLQAEPGTIRGDLAVQTGRNVVHGSDSPENGKREIGLWFKEGEVCQWTSAQAPWLRE